MRRSIFESGLMCVAFMALANAADNCVECLYEDRSWCATDSLCVDMDAACTTAEEAVIGFSECQIQPGVVEAGKEPGECPAATMEITDAYLATTPTLVSEEPIDYETVFAPHIKTLSPGQSCRVTITATGSSKSFGFWGADEGIAVVGTNTASPDVYDATTSALDWNREGVLVPESKGNHATYRLDATTGARVLVRDTDEWTLTIMNTGAAPASLALIYGSAVQLVAGAIVAAAALAF